MSDRPTVADTRLKRPVYRTYGDLIKILVSDAVARIKDEKKRPLDPPKPSAHLRRVADRLKRTRTAMRKLESELRRHDLELSSSYDGERATLQWTYSYRNKGEQKPSVRYQRRYQAIQALKVKAALDTIDLTPAEAKAYLLKLQRQLEKV